MKQYYIATSSNTFLAIDSSNQDVKEEMESLKSQGFKFHEEIIEAKDSSTAIKIYKAKTGADKLLTPLVKSWLILLLIVSVVLFGAGYNKGYSFVDSDKCASLKGNSLASALISMFVDKMVESSTSFPIYRQGVAYGVKSAIGTCMAGKEAFTKLDACGHLKGMDVYTTGWNKTDSNRFLCTRESAPIKGNKLVYSIESHDATDWSKLVFLADLKEPGRSKDAKTLYVKGINQIIKSITKNNDDLIKSQEGFFRNVDLYKLKKPQVLLSSEGNDIQYVMQVYPEVIKTDSNFDDRVYTFSLTKQTNR